MTTVTADPFDYESVPSSLTSQTNAVFSIGNKTLVENVEVGSAPTSEPTYVDGSTLQFTNNGGTNWLFYYGRYNIENAISTGYLVFRADMYCDNSPTYIRFLDEDENELLRLGFNNGSNDRYYQYVVNRGSGMNCDMHTTYRSYHGFAIEDLVINMSTGAVNFKLDYIDTNNSNKRAVTSCSKNISFGSGKTVKYLELGTVRNNNQTVHFDNIQFYHVDTYANVYATYKTDNYGTKVSALDAAGQAYWTANTTPTITTAAQYKTAVDALPATYVSAVKAQTTGGSNMTDAMPQALTDWTCSQGNGPGTYATTFTETYSDGGDTYAKFSAGTIMSQTITGLPNGYYKVQFYGIVNAANNVSTVSGTNLVQAYANSADLDIDVVLQNSCTPTDYLRTIEAQVTDGTLTYGLKAKDGVTDAGNWAVAKIYALTYLGSTKYDYTINAVADGSTIKTLATGSEFPSDSYGVYIPKVIYNDTDSKYYVLDDDNNANLDGYYASYTMGTTDATKEINYTVDESIVGYTEGVGSGYRNVVASNNSSYSGGDYINNNAGSGLNKRNRGFGIGTLSKGIYQMVVYVVNTTRGRAVALRDMSSETAAADPIIQITNSGKITGELTKNFQLTESTTLGVNGANTDGGKNNQMEDFDYVIIRKLNVNDSPVIVGDINNGTGYLGATSEKATLKPGESYHYQFVNHWGGTNNWWNWHLPVYKSDDSRPITLRTDWWDDMNGTTDAEHQRGFSTDAANYWANVPSKMDGVTVDMTVTFTADKKFVMTSSNTAKDGTTWTYNYTSDNENNIDLTSEASIQVALSVNASWLEILSEGYSAVSKPITSAGWATYCSPYALDLANATGLTDAYIVTGGSNGVLAKTSVKGVTVPANTGLLLKGDAGTATMPVVSTSETSVAENILVGTTADTPIAALTGWVLMGTPSLGFYQNKNEFTVGANTAYIPVTNLPVPESGSAHAFLLFDDDATTGISTANRETTGNGNCYNLNGQRVEQPKKGLYIVNGKKCIVK